MPDSFRFSGNADPRPGARGFKLRIPRALRRARPGRGSASDKAKPLFLLAAALLAALLSGCGGEDVVEPASIRHAGHAVLSGALGQPLANDLRFLVSGKGASGFFGAKQAPAPGVKIAFAVFRQPDGASAGLTPAEAVTDAGGAASARLVLGDKPGIYRVEARIVGRPDIPPVNLDVIGGAIVSGGDQDGWVGEWLERSLAVRLESAPGVFLGKGEGAVRFDLRSGPGGVGLSRPDPETDEDGFAATRVSLGRSQGPGEIGVSIARGIPGADHYNLYLPVRFFVIDGWLLAMAMLGGVALFLFGMRMMSDGLQHAAGDRLRGLLSLLTRNRVMAAGAGATVTALIQSSSACTVMVVGFLNAGLMRLEQAIGVIMGANIGTTVTAQIIAFKLSGLALPAVTAGVIVTFVARRQALRYWGGILIGFGVLFLGMNIMSDSLGELRNSTSMISLFEGLNCVPGPGGRVPLLQFFKAIGVGLGITLILQSSAATIGMLLAVASAGLIDPYAAFGILLGDNIGTTITAVLAAIGSGVAAKRAACFHVMFNVIGVIIMIILNYADWPGGGGGRPVFMELANMFTPGDVFAGENLPRFLANAHTLFNVCCTVMFMPFAISFAALCRLVIKPGGDEEAAPEARRILEPHLLATPSLAIRQVWTEVGVMLAKGREAQTEGFKAIISADTPDWDQLTKTAHRLEQETDELQAAVTNYLSGIPLTGLNEAQSEMFPRMIRTVNDAERIGDLGRHLSKLGKRVKKRSISITPEAVDEMKTMIGVVEEIIRLAEKTIEVNADGIETGGGGGVLRQKLLDDGKRLDKTAKIKASEFRKNHEKRHEAGLCDIRSGVIFLDAVNTLARSAGHALNVIEAACHASARRKEK